MFREASPPQHTMPLDGGGGTAEVVVVIVLLRLDGRCSGCSPPFCLCVADGLHVHVCILLNKEGSRNVRFVYGRPPSQVFLRVVFFVCWVVKRWWEGMEWAFCVGLTLRKGCCCWRGWRLCSVFSFAVLDGVGQLRGRAMAGPYVAWFRNGCSGTDVGRPGPRAVGVLEAT